MVRGHQFIWCEDTNSFGAGHQFIWCEDNNSFGADTIIHLLSPTTNRLWEFPIHLGTQIICYSYHKQIVVIPNSFGNTNHLLPPPQTDCGNSQFIWERKPFVTLPPQIDCGYSQFIWEYKPFVTTTNRLWETPFHLGGTSHLLLPLQIDCGSPKSFGYLPFCLVCATQTIWVPAIRFGVCPPKSFGYLPFYLMRDTNSFGIEHQFNWYGTPIHLVRNTNSFGVRHQFIWCETPIHLV